MDNVLINNADLYRSVKSVRATTPNYREKVDRGEYIPPLPYSLKIANSAACVYTALYSWVGGGASSGKSGKYTTSTKPGPISGDYPNGVINTNYKIARSRCESDLSALASNRDNKLLSKIQAQSLPLILMYKERRETGRLITSFLDKILFTFRNVRHPSKILKEYGFVKAKKQGYFNRRTRKYVSVKKLRALARLANIKTFGDAWLQYRFAWLPFIRDIFDSVKAASEFEKKIHTYHRTAGLPFEFVNETQAYKGKLYGFYRIGCSYTITDNSLESAVGSIMNPAAAAWDAVPWSFVLDWIADISGYLTLMTATLGTAFKEGYRSVLKSFDFINKQLPATSYRTGNFPYDYTSYTVTYSGAVSARSDVEFTRSVLQSFPRPTLEYPLAASFVHGIDSLSLLVQKFGHKLIKR